MTENKTKATEASVDAFLGAVEPAQKREDAFALRTLMERLSGEPAKMWGPSIVGFGTHHYRYESGREGDICKIGFSPRANALTLYIHSGSPAYAALLPTLGKVKTGKSCLYVKSLADIDLDVLERMIAATLAHAP